MDFNITLQQAEEDGIMISLQAFCSFFTQDNWIEEAFENSKEKIVSYLENVKEVNQIKGIQEFEIRNFEVSI